MTGFDGALRVDDWRALPSGFWRWRNFTPAEMADSEDRSLLVVPAFMDKLQALRGALGVALPVSSGYRTPEHNAQISSSGPDGPHTTGRAVDLTVSGAVAWRLLTGGLLQAHGFTGLGVRQRGDWATRFIHLDDLEPGPRRPRPHVWTY